MDAARDAVRTLPASVTAVELRLDRLDPGEFASLAWRSLPGEFDREWIATWRSPAEGGEGGECPPGTLARALESGYRWVDVEAAQLARGDAGASTVPVERRWVSSHPAAAPRSPRELRDAWDALSGPAGALHKLVVPADRFEVNTWIAELDSGLGPGTSAARAIFALGWIGHVSRIQARIAGHGVTFLSPGVAEATAPGQPSVELALSVYGLERVSPATRLYGVLGNPARRSRSPEIHNAVFREIGHDGLHLMIESESASPALEWVRAGRLRGLSVTAPFKREAAAAVDALEESARRSGSVNTVFVRDGRLWGADTDGAAMGDLLDELGVRPGEAMALFGAGGAARAVAQSARDRAVTVTLFNRSADSGEAAARTLGLTWGGDGRGCDPSRFRVLVNATPAGSEAPFPGTRVLPESLIIDLSYDANPTAWEDLALRAGCGYRGGLEFLARQAVGQQERWTGHRPRWDRILSALGEAGRGVRP